MNRIKASVPNAGPGVTVEERRFVASNRTLGQLPGVSYPSPLPSTTREFVDRNLHSNIPGNWSNAIRKFFAKEQTPAKVLEVHKSWADLAWNTRIAFENEIRNMEQDLQSRLGSLPGGFAERFSQFLKPWKDFLADKHRRWNLVFPAKTSLENHLRALSLDSIVSKEAMLEAERQSASYAYAVKQMTDFAEQERSQLKPIAERYVSESRFVAKIGETIGQVIKGVFGVAEGIIKTTLTDLLPPILGALPWYIWVAGAGALYLYLRPIIARLIPRQASA